MGGSVLPVQTQCEANQAGVCKAPNRLPRNKWRRRRRHCDTQSLVAGVTDDVKDVGPLGGIATGQDENGKRLAKCFDAPDKPLRFYEVQLFGISFRFRFGAAMKACQIASPGCLPDDGERTLIEVHQLSG